MCLLKPCPHHPPSFAPMMLVPASQLSRSDISASLSSKSNTAAFSAWRAGLMLLGSGTKPFWMLQRSSTCDVAVSRVRTSKLKPAWRQNHVLAPHPCNMQQTQYKDHEADRVLHSTRYMTRCGCAQTSVQPVLTQHVMSPAASCVLLWCSAPACVQQDQHASPSGCSENRCCLLVVPTCAGVLPTLAASCTSAGSASLVP